MQKSKQKNYPSTLIDRHTMIAILNAAISTGSTRFARRAAFAWLENYSGDLAVEYFQAQSLLKDGLTADAIPLLKQICYTDPEYLPAQRLLAYSSNHAQFASVATAQGCIAALGGSDRGTVSLPTWSELLGKARLASREKKVAEAEVYFQQALAEQPDSPLPAVLHLKFAAENYDWKAKFDLGERYTSRWPDALACILIHADTLTSGGQEDKAVNLLHRAVSLDIGGQVAIQLWGTQHPYSDLWPRDPQLDLAIPVPAEVATAMGWNQLPEGGQNEADYQSPAEIRSHSQSKSQYEIQNSNQVIETAKSEFEKLAAKLKKSDLGKGDGRFPAYIVITTQQGLEKQYGAEQLAKIDASLKQVVRSTQALHNWNSYLIYVDDAKCTDQFGLPPAKSKDAWSIKTFISELDHSLARRGEMIGAILIVGGPKVVPFHHLPNPIDDFDTDVPSDNPYACNDENYFVPTWSVGRLPGSDGSDPSPLLSQLDQIVQDRSQQILQEKRSRLSQILDFLRSKFGTRTNKHSFGYSAEVWQRAAHSVYRPIGKPHTLVISPPTQADYFAGRKHKPSRLAYYNLHGLEDAPEWYGQRDPIETINGPDYPIALRPQDIQNSGRAPHIVFSEACFGANIFRKKVEDAIVLKFLDSGTKAIVGSTCTSYGSIAPPLIAADLLGKAFWSFLKDGFPAGEALRRAKIHLAKDMNKRQGYLDGEDQKTLVSFVLYGDPLAQPDRLPDGTSTKGNLRLIYNAENLKTVCDKVNQPGEHEIPPEVVRQVKAVVKQYLPGMSDAQILYSHEHLECTGHDCPTHQLGAKSAPAKKPTRKVVTLSKKYEKGSGTHQQHARITLDEEGKMIKLAVSR
jgi:tetratricopeptide (TPR) repeat protein